LKGDTITCKITLVNEYNVFYSYKHKRNAIKDSFIPRSQLIAFRLHSPGVSVPPFGENPQKTNTPVNYSENNGINANGHDTVKNHRYNYQFNNIFVEVAGNSFLFGSLNYERVLLKRGNFYLNLRIGIGYGLTDTRFLSMPLGFNGILQIYRALAWEIGLGLSLIDAYRPDASPRNSLVEDEGIPALIPSTGLRIQDKNGVLFRLDFTPFYNLNIVGQLLPPKRFTPWGGLSIGYGLDRKNKRVGSQQSAVGR